MSVQAQILNLLQDMKARYGLTLIFIAHDLAVVKNVSDRVAVMYLGKICEVCGPDELYEAPAHPYTAALLSAIPVPDPSVDADASAPASAARSRRRSRRRAAAGSAPAARGPTELCAAAGAADPRGPARPLRGLPLPARDRREAPAPSTVDRRRRRLPRVLTIARRAFADVADARSDSRRRAVGQRSMVRVMRDGLEQAAVVADEQQGAVVAVERELELLDRLEVEVVGRLVEHEAVHSPGHQRGEDRPAPLPR